MENYVKGKNVETELNECDIPFRGLSKAEITTASGRLLWMRVNPASKVQSFVQRAISGFESPDSQIQAVLFSGFGPALARAISCAEVFQRKS